MFSVARVMLIDERRLEHLSSVIVAIRLPFRIQFEGVALSPHRTRSSDPRHISGKLLYKDSPFSGWVHERVRRRGTDALCVNSPADLRGYGARVTRSGQTRHGSRGAHGEMSDAAIISFSNADRIAQIAADIAALTAQVGELARVPERVNTSRRSCGADHQPEPVSREVNVGNAAGRSPREPQFGRLRPLRRQRSRSVVKPGHRAPTVDRG